MAVVWVHYHTPALLRQSVAAVRADLPVSADEAELIVVDNGGLDAAPAGTRLLRPARNVGYAGGINAGVAASQAPGILVMNPDVIVRPGCVPALMNALQRFPIVAPDLYLDRDRQFRMPPIEPCDFISVCVAELGRRRRRWTRYARRRWRRHAHRYWQARPGGSTGCHASGAMLGFSREAFQAVGPWDENFQLYFEEADWLQRARRRNLNSTLITKARAVHLYAKSSRKQPCAEHWFAGSRSRFEHMYYRTWQNRLLRVIRNRDEEPEIPAPDHRQAPSTPAWAELSHAPCGFPAVTARVQDPAAFRLADSLRDQLSAGNYWLRWVDDHRREISVSRIPVAPGPRSAHE